MGSSKSPTVQLVFLLAALCLLSNTAVAIRLATPIAADELVTGTVANHHRKLHQMGKLQSDL